MPQTSSPLPQPEIPSHWVWKLKPKAEFLSLLLTGTLTSSSPAWFLHTTDGWGHSGVPAVSPQLLPCSQGTGRLALATQWWILQGGAGVLPCARELCHFSFGNRDRVQRELIADVVPTACGRSTVTGKIFGGQPSAAERWPWLASVVVRRKHICGASLISNSWLLSAGSCVQRFVFALRTSSCWARW